MANPDLLKPLSRSKRQELATLTRVELEDRVVSLEKHVQQLRNVIAKHTGSSMPQVRHKLQSEKFDFDRFKRRHVLLRVSYFGWDYMGFATQEDAGKSIESELFAALLQTKLVRSREESNYHRCGRTDRGVSATGQVISLDLRTALMDGDGVFAQEGFKGEGPGKEEEIDYCTVLNRNLPPEIRVTGWAPAPRLDYSARFDCNSRTYHYYFPRASASLTSMQSAGQRMIGEHDFRNFCKMDVNNGVVKFMRRVDSISVDCVLQEEEEAGPFDICRVKITAKAFLWHQVRCLVAVLLLVGEGREDEEVVTKLLDIEAIPCKPAYNMVSDLPLNLFSTEFPGVEWRLSDYAREHVDRSGQEVWGRLAVRAAIVRDHLREAGGSTVAQLEWLQGRRREKKYTPLLQLPRGPSLSDKIRTVAKRRKIDMEGAVGGDQSDHMEEGDV